MPTLTSISPTSGPSAGGTTITLTGTNFASGATVRVNGVAATGVTFVSATQVRATTPAGSAGARTVQITNPSGQSASLAGAFTYVGGPGLTSVSPTSGPTAGGTTITITGSGFVSGATCGSTARRPASLRRRRCAPAAAGTYAVQVTNPDGQAGTLNGGLHLPGRADRHVGLADLGPDGRRHHHHVTGTAFVSGATVRVNGVAATGVTFLSATQVRAVTPAGTAGARSVQVTNPDGQAGTLAGAFTYTTPTPTPTLTAVSPASGPTTGGTTVTLTGTNFAAGATVTVGGTAATSVVVASATSITASDAGRRRRRA